MSPHLIALIFCPEGETGSGVFEVVYRKGIHEDDEMVARNAKSLIGVMVLPFAALPALLFRGRRLPAVAHLVFSLHLYAFLLLSNEKTLTLPVALGNFLSADDSPWELLMTAGFIYALPPAAIYYAFRKYMSSGLTAGAVKG